MQKFLIVAASLILAWPARASAQATDEGNSSAQRQNPGQATTNQPVKEPPPPLFPKHRRGRYQGAEGQALLDATPQSPPLEIDDPGVPDKGEYEINLSSFGDLSKGVNEFDLFQLDANYGVVLKIAGRNLPTQLKVEFPIAGSKEIGQPFSAGVGAFKVGVKINFYNDEHRGVFMSFYPQVESAAVGTHAVEKGLADPGQTVTLPLLVQMELSHVTLVVNGAIQLIHAPDRTTSSYVGVGIGRALTQHMVFMTEARLVSAIALDRDRQVAINAGIMRSVSEKLIVYGKLGRSVWSDDGGAHTFVGFGLKVMTASNQKSTH